MTASFVCRTVSALPRERLFDLARSIEAHLESQKVAGEEAVGGVTSGLIGEGQEVTWQARHFGIPLRMTSRITELEAPHWFVDEQVRGPFRTFRHEHAFVPDGDGTLMIDHVVFESALGGLGRAAEAVIGPHLVRLIERRNAYIRDGSKP